MMGVGTISVGTKKERIPLAIPFVAFGLVLSFDEVEEYKYKCGG